MVTALTFTTPQILAIIIGTAVFYALIVALVYAKKYWHPAPETAPPPLATAAGASLIGPTVLQPTYRMSDVNIRGNAPPVFADPDPEELFDESFLPDEDIPFAEEQPITLLKEAERVVEQIQFVVDNIASRPANPEEVFMKIQAIVSEYSFFFDTEYYDAINRFVAVTIHRDCDLQLSEEDIKSLWHAAAA